MRKVGFSTDFGIDSAS